MGAQGALPGSRETESTFSRLHQKIFVVEGTDEVSALPTQPFQVQFSTFPKI